MEKKRILYVDNDGALAETVRETLERAGYEVAVDTDSQNALRGFAKEPNKCDMAIIAQLMPRMKGTELARWLRVSRNDLPIILVTGHPELVSERETKRAGIQEVLYKPLTRPELCAAIDRALSRATPMVGSDVGRDRIRPDNGEG